MYQFIKQSLYVLCLMSLFQQVDLNVTNISCFVDVETAGYAILGKLLPF